MRARRENGLKRYQFTDDDLYEASAHLRLGLSGVREVMSHLTRVFGSDDGEEGGGEADE